jgi:hypothetical protein
MLPEADCGLDFVAGPAQGEYGDVKLDPAVVPEIFHRRGHDTVLEGLITRRNEAIVAIGTELPVNAVDNHIWSQLGLLKNTRGCHTGPSWLTPIRT